MPARAHRFRNASNRSRGFVSVLRRAGESFGSGTRRHAADAVLDHAPRAGRSTRSAARPRVGDHLVEERIGDHESGDRGGIDGSGE